MDWFLKLIGVSSKNRKLASKVTKGLSAFAAKEPTATTPKQKQRLVAKKTEVVEIEDLPYDEYEIVGESNYQATLAKFAGPKTELGANMPCTVLLICEKGNPHDRLAVRVELQGETVGYLAREHARAFRAMLAEEGLRGAQVRSSALITGGWKSADSEGYFGIALAPE